MQHSAGDDRTTILVVEDDPTVRRAMSLLLSSYGYAVREASAVEAAQDMILQHTDIALVIVDVALDAESGLDLVTWIRDTRPALPYIVMTGAPGPDDLDAPVLMKPVPIHRLLATIETALSHTRSPPLD